MSEKSMVIESYNAYIEKIPNGLNYIIEKLRNNEIECAMKAILDFSEGLVWLMDAAMLLRKNKVTVSLEIKKIEGFLKEINEGIEKQDFLLVADIFEYELLEFFTSLEITN